MEVIHTVTRELGWDESLILSMPTDDHTFVIQVRKSALVFTITQEHAHSDRFAVSYTAYDPGAEPQTTVRRFTSGHFRSAGSIDEDLNRWLRQTVARHAAQSALPD